MRKITKKRKRIAIQRSFSCAYLCGVIRVHEDYKRENYLQTKNKNRTTRVIVGLLIMRKISDFENCRLDMKQMAALTGGIVKSGGSDSVKTVAGCGDVCTTYWTDDENGVRRPVKIEMCNVECPAS